MFELAPSTPEEAIAALARYEVEVVGPALARYEVEVVGPAAA